jgi:hypothetical protein
MTYITDVGDSSGGTGVQSAENVGTTGDGLFKQRLGNVLEFKNVESGSSSIVISENFLKDTLTFDINVSGIDHTQLLNSGNVTHDQIDSHIINTNNPHNITASDVGNTYPIWNSNKIMNVGITSTPPANKSILRYHSSSNLYESDNHNEETTSSFFDDFYGSDLGHSWVVDTVGSNSDIFLVDGVGGQVKLESGTSLGDYTDLMINRKTITSGTISSIKFRMKMSDITNTKIKIGVVSDQLNLVQFIYDTKLATGNWFGESINTNSSIVNTGIVGDTDWHMFEIKLSPTSVKFFVDNNLKATIVSNIPSVVMGFFIKQESNSTLKRHILVDFVKIISDRDGAPQGTGGGGM